MRASPLPVLLLAAVAACSDSPLAPASDATSEPPSASILANRTSTAFNLILGSSRESPSEAWGVAYLRAGLAPPNPCRPFAIRRLQGLSVCAILLNPAFERIDAMTFEVAVPAGVEVLRGFVSAPPSPCNAAVITGILPADLSGATGVTVTVETDVGIVVSSPTEAWPGGSPSELRPCALTVTLG